MISHQQQRHRLLSLFPRPSLPYWLLPLLSPFLWLSPPVPQYAHSSSSGRPPPSILFCSSFVIAPQSRPLKKHRHYYKDHYVDKEYYRRSYYHKITTITTGIKIRRRRWLWNRTLTTFSLSNSENDASSSFFPGADHLYYSDPMSILSSHSSTLLSQLSAQAPSTTATNEAQLPSQQLSDYDIPSTTTKKFNTNNNEGIISATNKQGRILSNVINSETTPYDMTYRTNDNNNGIINNNSSPRTTSRGQQKITLTRYLSDIVHDNPELREMERLLLSLQMACRTISNLVSQRRTSTIVPLSSSVISPTSPSSKQSSKKSTSYSGSSSDVGGVLQQQQQQGQSSSSKEKADTDAVTIKSSFRNEADTTIRERPTTTTSRSNSGISSSRQFNSMVQLDELSSSVLRNALRFTGKLEMVKLATCDTSTSSTATASTNVDLGNEEAEQKSSFCSTTLSSRKNEHQSGVLIASALHSKYVALFDPLDGSNNADASICTGTIFGIFKSNPKEENGEQEEGETNDGRGGSTAVRSKVDLTRGGSNDSLQKIEPLKIDANEEDATASRSPLLNSVLQPGRNLQAAGYCLYSSSTILVFTIGDGTHMFTLDSQLNEFVLTQSNIRIPQRGNIYSTNESNSNGWDASVSSYISSLKSGKNRSGVRYTSRYIGSLVGDIHRTLMYGGIFAYPSDIPHHPHGNLQLLYKSAPMAYIVSQAGGMSSTGTEELLDVMPTRVHERQPCFIGSPEDIEEMRTYMIATTAEKDA